MKKNKKLKIGIASLFVLISLVLLISQINNNKSLNSELLSVDYTSLIAAPSISADKSAIVTEGEYYSLVWKPFEINQIEKGMDCYEPEKKSYSSSGFLAHQAENLSIYNIYKEITDLNNKLSLANSSKAYANQKLDEANQSLKLFGEIKAGESYTFVVYPKGVKSSTQYDTVSGLHYICVGLKNYSGADGNLVGTTGKTPYKILSDDPKGYKNLQSVIDLWSAFATKGKLGYTDLLSALNNQNDYDISLNDRKEVNNRDKIVISVISSSQDCIKVDFKNRKEAKLKEEACASESIRKEYSKYIEGVLKARVKDYKQMVKDYSSAVNDLEVKRNSLIAKLNPNITQVKTSR